MSNTQTPNSHSPSGSLRSPSSLRVRGRATQAPLQTQLAQPRPPQLISPRFTPPVPNVQRSFPGTSTCVPAVSGSAGSSRKLQGALRGRTVQAHPSHLGACCRRYLLPWVPPARRPPLQLRARHPAQPGPAPHLKPGSAPRPLRARGPAAPQTLRYPPAAVCRRCPQCACPAGELKLRNWGACAGLGTRPLDLGRDHLFSSQNPGNCSFQASSSSASRKTRSSS